MRLVDAQYEHGMLRLSEQLALRPGERVSVIVVRKPDPQRWNLARLSVPSDDETALSEHGLADWADVLDSEDRM